MAGRTRTHRAPPRGGARPGSGPKSVYPGKRWEHCVSLTGRALARLDALRGATSRNDAIESLLRGAAAEVTDPVARDDLKAPRSIRLTDDGSRLLRRHAQRANMPQSALVETLIMQYR